MFRVEQRRSSFPSISSVSRGWSLASRCAFARMCASSFLILLLSIDSGFQLGNALFEITVTNESAEAHEDVRQALRVAQVEPPHSRSAIDASHLRPHVADGSQRADPGRRAGML